MNTTARPEQICGKPREQAGHFLRAARSAGDRHREAAALIDKGLVHLHARQFPEALADFRASLELARQLGDPFQENDSLVNLALALLATNQPNEAREILEEQVAKAEKKGEFFEEKMVLDHLGAVYVKLGNIDKALAVYEQAFALAQKVGDRPHQADLLWIMAIQHAQLRQRDRAIVFGQKAIALYEEIGFPNVAQLASTLRQFAESNESGELAAPDSPPAGYYTDPTTADDLAGMDRFQRLEGGPGLLWMAFSAAKAVGQYLTSDLTTASTAVHEKRLQTCAGCLYHTGLRCKLCGCFTSIKAWLPHEKCPAGKWHP